MKKILFLLIFSLSLISSIVLINAYSGDKITWFLIQGTKIKIVGDPLPTGFDQSGNGTDNVIVTSSFKKYNFFDGGYATYTFPVLHLYLYDGGGMMPPIVKVIHNGMSIEMSECHYVNEPDTFLKQIVSICYDSEDTVRINWNIASEPSWYYDIEQAFLTVGNMFLSINTTINNIQNTLTNHETRISALEQITTTTTTLTIATTTSTTSTTVTTTTTLPTTTTTITISTTTTTIPSNIEERLSIIEKMICQIKYIDGFCPPRCPRPYSCSNTCEDDTRPSICYDRTTHPEYYCSSNRNCCESVRVPCPS